MSKKLNLNQIQELFEQGVRSVYVVYHKDKWYLPVTELVNEYHSIKKEGMVIDLYDSRNEPLGLDIEILRTNKISVYKTKEDSLC